jgi:hypothetical protein
LSCEPWLAQSAQELDTLAEEQRRRTKFQADLAELDVQERLRQLLPVDEVLVRFP